MSIYSDCVNDSTEIKIGQAWDCGYHFRVVTDIRTFSVRDRLEREYKLDIVTYDTMDDNNWLRGRKIGLSLFRSQIMILHMEDVRKDKVWGEMYKKL